MQERSSRWHTMASAASPDEEKRSRFQRYLLTSNISPTITELLAKLYDEAVWPPNGLDWMRRNLGAPGIEVTFNMEVLSKENVALKKRIAELEAELQQLRPVTEGAAASSRKGSRKARSARSRSPPTEPTPGGRKNAPTLAKNKKSSSGGSDGTGPPAAKGGGAVSDERVEKQKSERPANKSDSRGAAGAGAGDGTSAGATASLIQY